MSETLSQDPESLGSGYGLASNYPPTPATPSSTVQDPPGSNLPPFSTFSADMDTASGFATDRFLSDTRLLDISNWEYYPEARILERTENGLSIIASQPQYRPWESKPVDATFAPTAPVTTFADAFAQNGVSKLPSFQSQFQTFNEPVTTTEPTTLTTLTNLTPVSPNSSSPTLTTLNPANFHTLNPRNYPLVPAPIQAREIPSIQQQFLDERHIQLYTHPTANIATLNPAAGGIFQPQNGAIIQGNQLLGSPTVVTVIKSEPDLKLVGASNLAQDSHAGLKIQSLHPTHFQNPMSTMMVDNNGLYNGLDKKLNGMNAAALGSPTRNDFRKKERRKMRASSLESSAESDGASSNMEIGSESSGQVAAVSSTASFKSHHAIPANSSLEVDEISGGNVDKQVKKKRKRCGECIGCQRKDNCGDCAPCRNDKSHQICKQRRCEKLTEKKNLYGDQSYIRGESRRGRGKGRGAGSYRGRKPSGPVSLSNTAVPEPSVPSSRPSPQPIHMLKPEQPVQQQQQQQPMAPMPFYADPTRFTAPVWQTEPAAQAWSQGQFIQQISASAQPTLEAYPPQQYPNGIYPATYQQPATFETGTFYTGVQVLTNAVRPPSAQQLTPRANGSYSHTPSPVPQQQAQPQPTAQRSNISGQYHQEYVNNQGYVAPTTPTGGGGLDNSRPSSVNSAANVPTSGQNFQQSGNFTSVSSTNFSPGSANANQNFAGSGNEKPGYPQVNSSPRLVSHSSSGYPGDEYSGNIQSEHWPVVNSENMLWEPPGIGQQNLEGAKSNPEHGGEDQFSQSSRVNLNSRIKTMILNKQQNVERKSDEEQQQQNRGEGDDKTGHFLWYSHHRRPPDLIGGGGGVPSPTSDLRNLLLLDRSRHGFRNESKSRRDAGGHDDHPPLGEKSSPRRPSNCFAGDGNCESEDNKIKNSSGGADVPHCDCFPPDKMPPEPGSYYAHLGCASSLANLRKDLETRTGTSGPAIRIEKIRYTGKEGKTAQGCPLAKWIIRRANPDEKYLILVKHRQGHACVSAYIVVCIVAWEGVSLVDTDSLYATLADKLNSFGVATNRRCATNEQRTCACQGLDPKTCGASFSFGCSWSMYYNGCKFARSKVVRKFRLAEKSEEENVERKLQSLATQVAPLYRILAPDSFKNQCDHEDVAGDCRLGSNRGRPFSGVTACMDFCAHAHKDSHNMNNGCTVVVSLTKERSLSKPEDEQLHVLPLYTVDGTDELGSKENQDAKIRSGSIEILKRYECEVRVRTVPLQPCRRRKKKEEDPSLKESPLKRDSSGTSSGYDSSRSQTPQTPGKNTDGVLQSNHISSTVLDSPKSWTYDNCYHYNRHDYNQDANDFPTYSSVLTQDKANATAFNFTYPKPRAQNILLQNKVQDSYSGIRIPNRIPSNGGEYNGFGVGPGPEASPYDFRYEPDANAPFKIPQTPPQEFSARLFHGNFLPYSQSPPHTSYPSENLLQQNNDDDFGYNPAGFVRNDHHWDVWRNHSLADTSRIIRESLLPRSSSAWSPFRQHDVGLNYQLCNPFDDFGDYGLKRSDVSLAPDCGYFSPPTPWSSPKSNWDAPRETLGKVTDVVDNAESFRDSQVGGVAIALGHGSVLFECAKHELHATTALKKPDRTSPTRISLVFYQHRNLNRPRHGWDQWEEKNKLKKLGLNDVNLKLKLEKIEVPDLKALVRKNNAEILLRAPTLTTMSVTTLFPMYPCMVTGPYQEAHSFG